MKEEDVITILRLLNAASVKFTPESAGEPDAGR
jgi:hypothetical protein